MIIRSKAPFRLGLAGGGTDVSPYSDIFGGAILNATVNLYARTTIQPRNDNKIIINNTVSGKSYTFDSTDKLELNDEIDLQIGVYNRIVRSYNKKPLSFEMTTALDVPTRSGLGTSSTLVVSILGAFAEWLTLPLGEYDIAHLAYEIERKDLKMPGGKQDQYAATFGGVNFMEFLNEDKVIVNPLRTKDHFLSELNHNLVLYHMNAMRDSSKIIKDQMQNVLKEDKKAVEAMHQLKREAYHMKMAFLSSDINQIGEILDRSWKMKKQMASGISNSKIDEIYQAAINTGALGGKISGAGGGGFLMFLVADKNRFQFIEKLKEFGGQIINYEFTNKGLDSWVVE